MRNSRQTNLFSISFHDHLSTLVAPFSSLHSSLTSLLTRRSRLLTITPLSSLAPLSTLTSLVSPQSSFHSCLSILVSHSHHSTLGITIALSSLSSLKTPLPSIVFPLMYIRSRLSTLIATQSSPHSHLCSLVSPPSSLHFHPIPPPYARIQLIRSLPPPCVYHIYLIVSHLFPISKR